MKYVTPSGQVYTADSDEELVSLLHEGSYVQCESDDEFMKAMARRVKLQMGSEVSTADAHAFVQDLIKVGFLKEEAD